jgi:hypothetical protein
MRNMTRVVAILLFSAVSFAATASELLIFTAGENASQTVAIPAGTTYPAGATGGGGMIGGAIGFSTLGGFSSVTLHINITDCCLVGDVYEAILDGVSAGITAAEPIGGSTLSTGDFFVTVAGGAHSVNVWDIVLSYLGLASPFGGGIVTSNYSPAGFTITVSQVVPEPSSMLLLGIGLVALGVFGRRKLN